MALLSDIGLHSISNITYLAAAFVRCREPAFVQIDQILWLKIAGCAAITFIAFDPLHRSVSARFVHYSLFSLFFRAYRSSGSSGLPELMQRSRPVSRQGAHADDRSHA